MKKSFLFLFLMALLPLVSWATGEAKFSINGGQSWVNSIEQNDVASLKVYVDDYEPGTYETEATSVTWYYSSTANPSSWAESQAPAVAGAAGYYKATVVSGQNDWEGILTVNGEPQPQGNDLISMSNFTVIMDLRTYVFSGSKPNFVATVTDPNQTQPVDANSYEWVIYTSATGTTTLESPYAAGTYYVAAKAKEGNGFYKDETQRLQIVIDRKDIAETGVEIADFDDVTFKNAAYGEADFDFTGKVTYGTQTLVLNQDYTVAFTNSTNAGEATITFTGKEGSNYKGTTTKKFTINPKEVTEPEFTITVASAGTYTGAQRKPNVTISWANGNLVKDTDFTLAYANNVNAGNEATVTISFDGNYTGEAIVKNFSIARCAAGNITVIAAFADAVYTGEPIIPTYTKYFQWASHGNLKESTDEGVTGDYTIVYSDNVNVGQATAKVTFINNFSGTKTLHFNITAKPVTVTCTNFTVSSGANIEVPAPTFTTTQPEGITPIDEAAFAELNFIYAYGNTTIESTTKAPADGVYDYTITNGEAINNATPNNYTYTFVGGKMTVSGAQIWAAVNDVTVTYGTAAAFDVTYVSGLADGSSAESYNGLTGNAGGTFGRLVRGAYNANPRLLTFAVNDDAELTAAALAGTLDAGTYTITATGFTGTDAGATYLVSFKSATLTVNPFDLASNTVTATLDPTTFTYKGAAWEPTVTLNNVPNLNLKVNEVAVNADSYEVTYQNNVDASTDENPAKAIVTAKENTNYTGSIEIPFTINKAELRIIAKDATYSISEIANGVTYEWWVMESDLLGQDIPTTEAPLTDLATQLGFTGNVLVRHNGNKNVGVYENYLIPYADTENPATFTNYTAVYPTMPGNGTAGNAATCGTLTITAAKLVASVVPSQTKKYGEDLDDFSLEYVSGLPTGYESSFAQQYDAESVVCIVKAKNVTGIEEGTVMPENDYLPVGTYTVEFDEDNIVTTTSNYIMKNAETLGTITIEPRPITLMPADQTIEYGQDINKVLNAAVYDADTEASEGVTVFVLAPAQGEVGGFAAGEGIDKLGVKLVRAENTTGVGEHKHAISVADGENVNPNYDITYDNIGLSKAEGNLTVLRNSDYTFYLDDTENDNYEKIADFAGEEFEEITVYLTRSQVLGKKDGVDAVRSWNAEQWQALVLPFDVTIRELSAAFGYAIVNVVNPDATKEGDVRFKLQMTGKIAANTPFLIKLDEDLPVVELDGETKAEIKFTKPEGQSFTIVKPETDRPSVEAGMGYKFVGAYTDEEIDNTKSLYRFLIDGNQWAYIMETSSATWNIDPLNAYVDLTVAADDPEGARNVTFTMEEMGGKMTSIRSIDADEAVVAKYAEGMYNLNGMKMDGAPVQKGVYILNGKKIVVK